MKVLIGCDHAGLDLKLQVMAALPDIQWIDMGTHSADSTDYPDFADKVCQQISLDSKSNSDSRGLLICGSGQGMAIRANRYPQVRAALCWNAEIAQLSREHNNANILCLGSRFVSVELAVEMTNIFLKTEFAGGRHQQRVNKLSTDTGC